MASALPPIKGMLRRSLVLDLSTAIGLGTSFGYLWWYGWHIPRVRARDNFYAKLEKERIEAQKELLARVAASSSS
ncbi:cytochrome c oxidase family protein [Thermoascus aurantiacus ATCC 26904]